MESLYATSSDIPFLSEHDAHISASKQEEKVESKHVILLKEGKITLWFLRFGFFWDEIPVMNMLMILEEYRWKWYGKQLVEFWETEMREQWYSQVLTSTQEDEEAQHFYRKLWYTDIWSFRIPWDEADELLLHKKI